MATLIGKVGVVMKGGWSSSATYETLDAVSYYNSLYIAKRAVPANTTPTNTTYWQKAVGAESASKTNITSYKTSLVTGGSVYLLRSDNCITISGSINFAALDSSDILFDLSEVLDFTIGDDIKFVAFNSSGTFFKFMLSTGKKITSYGSNPAGQYVAFTFTFTY